MSEQERNNESIKQRILEFADEIEAKYLAEYNEKIQAGEEEVEKESISEIHYYEEIKFSARFELKPLKGVYVVYNTDKSIYIYKEDLDKETGNAQRELMATVNEKGEVVFTEEYKSLDQIVTDKNLENILNSNEENKGLELKQETIEAVEMEIKAGNIKEDDIDPKEMQELEQESDRAEQVVAMAELKIMPGTVQELPIEEINDSPDFKGHNRVAFGYSKAEHGYVFFDKNTGKKLVGPSVAANRQVITQSNGDIEIERHSAMMASPSNPNQLYTIEIGPYGDRQLNKVTRTTEGNFVGRGMNIRGKDKETDNATIKAMNKVETRENMGETAEDLVSMGVTDKKTSDWKMSGAELEEFKDTMLRQMGYPMTEAELIEMYAEASDELQSEGEEPNFGNVVKRAQKNWAEQQAKRAGQDRADAENKEGRALGDRPEDPRRG